MASYNTLKTLCQDIKTLENKKKLIEKFRDLGKFAAKLWDTYNDQNKLPMPSFIEGNFNTDEDRQKYNKFNELLSNLDKKITEYLEDISCAKTEANIEKKAEKDCLNNIKQQIEEIQTKIWINDDSINTNELVKKLCEYQSLLNEEIEKEINKNPNTTLTEEVARRREQSTNGKQKVNTDIVRYKMKNQDKWLSLETEIRQNKARLKDYAMWMINTGDIAKLLEEGLIPYDTFLDIIQEDKNWFSRNVLASLPFIGKTVSLRERIRDKDLMVFTDKKKNKCVAVNPSTCLLEDGDLNPEIVAKLKAVFGDSIKPNLCTFIHGFCGYAANMPDVNGRYNQIIFCSNMPHNGICDTNNGCRERADKYSKVIKAFCQEFNPNKYNVVIEGFSHGCLPAAIICKNLTNDKINNVTNFKSVPTKVLFFQGYEDIASVINEEIDYNCYKKCKIIITPPNVSEGYHLCDNNKKLYNAINHRDNVYLKSCLEFEDKTSWDYVKKTNLNTEQNKEDNNSGIIRTDNYSTASDKRYYSFLKSKGGYDELTDDISETMVLEKNKDNNYSLDNFNVYSYGYDLKKPAFLADSVLRFNENKYLIQYIKNEKVLGIANYPPNSDNPCLVYFSELKTKDGPFMCYLVYNAKLKKFIFSVEAFHLNNGSTFYCQQTPRIYNTMSAQEKKAAEEQIKKKFLSEYGLDVFQKMKKDFIKDGLAGIKCLLNDVDLNLITGKYKITHEQFEEANFREIKEFDSREIIMLLDKMEIDRRLTKNDNAEKIKQQLLHFKTRELKQKPNNNENALVLSDNIKDQQTANKKNIDNTSNSANNHEKILQKNNSNSKNIEKKQNKNKPHSATNNKEAQKDNLEVKSPRSVKAVKNISKDSLNSQVLQLSKKSIKLK